MHEAMAEWLQAVAFREKLVHAAHAFGEHHHAEVLVEPLIGGGEIMAMEIEDEVALIVREMRKLPDETQVVLLEARGRTG